MLPSNYHIKVRVYNQERAFGHGVAQLLQLVKEQGCLSAAYRSMGMSSSKAWKIIHQAEADLGFKLVESISGGASGGSSCLTPQAEDLLDRYQSFNQAVQSYANEAFARYFAK